MPEGISNFQIENAIKNLEDDGIMKNFVGVFAANNINKFIDFISMIFEKIIKYPFLIANTDSLDTYWWSILLELKD